MGITSRERSALQELAAARLRGAKPEELLELAEAAVDQATAAGDAQTLESVAAELDLAAPAHPEQEDGLRLRLAAGRAGVIALRPRAVAAVEEVSVPLAAVVAFWVTVAVAALALSLVLVMAGQGNDSGYGIALALAFVVVLGSLVVAITGVAGFVQSVRAGSRRGVLMSAIPCVIVLALIGIRISLSLV
jgi:hypothetical protein